MTDAMDWQVVCAEVHHLLYGVDIAQNCTHTDWYYRQGESWLQVPDYLGDSNAVRELAADCMRIHGWTADVHKEGEQYNGWCWVRRSLGKRSHVYEALADTPAKAQLLVVLNALREVKHA